MGGDHIRPITLDLFGGEHVYPQEGRDSERPDVTSLAYFVPNQSGIMGQKQGGSLVSITKPLPGGVAPEWTRDWRRGEFTTTSVIVVSDDRTGLFVWIAGDLGGCDREQETTGCGDVRGGGLIMFVPPPPCRSDEVAFILQVSLLQ